MTDLETLRHSTAHLLAAAVLTLYPETRPAIGPATDEGFYYDFDLGDQKISAEDLPKIEQKMREIVKTWNKFEKISNNNQVIEQLSHNPYKKELIAELSCQGATLTAYRSGEFIDLCSGPHIEGKASETLKHFKLLKIAGAYWRGDSKNKMLTRIYGTAFFAKEELDKYLWQREEAEKRDHRKIGKDLDLFTFSDLVGSGLPLYTPKGATIRRLLAQYIEELQVKMDYRQVWTPQMAKAELFKISGHYDKYRENMFPVKSNYSGEEFFLKPMNCPQHTQIYAARQRSYKDLPLRYTDFAMLYRDEKPGELNGLARVRSFSQDDCHIFCREEQVDDEIDKALGMIKEVMNTFGFKYRYRLSTRDPKNFRGYLGNPATWDRVEKWAEEIMKRNRIDYFPGPGEAAFYAPKMDLMATDALGREWQLSTVQIDFVMPERFNLFYTDKDGAQKHPVMLHRAVLGSPERFIMILLEHFAGALPVWLSPAQVIILPLADRHLEYALAVNRELVSAGIRSEVDERTETLNAKIRDAQMQKIPYMLVMGDTEVKNGTVRARGRSGKDYGEHPTGEFIANLKKEIDNKTLD